MTECDVESSKLTHPNGPVTYPLFPSDETHQLACLHRLLLAPVIEPWSPSADNCSGTPRQSSGQNCSVPTHFSLWCAHPWHWFGYQCEKQMLSPESPTLHSGHMCYRTLQSNKSWSEIWVSFSTDTLFSILRFHLSWYNENKRVDGLNTQMRVKVVALQKQKIMKHKKSLNIKRNPDFLLAHFY